jgi:hypothetical protein
MFQTTTAPKGAVVGLPAHVPIRQHHRRRAGNLLPAYTN